MKILLAYPGKLNTVPMGRFSGDALRNLGHEVVEFDLSSNWLDKSIDWLNRDERHRNLNKRFKRLVDAERPDLMFAVFGFDLAPDTLEHLRSRGIPRACWWLNDPFQFSRSLLKAPHYDFLFTNSLGSVVDYRQAGVTHASWLPTACSPSVHRRADPLAEYHCDICFAGDWSPLREAWCEKLAEHFDLRIFGPWQKKLRHDSPLLAHVHDGFFTPENMVHMFASAKIVFNLHSWYGKWDHGTNPRLFEAAGCGSCQLVDWKQDIPELFDCETEIVTYLNEEELVAKVRELLEDDGFREILSNNAQRRAHADHTYENRMKTMLATVCGGL